MREWFYKFPNKKRAIKVFQIGNWGLLKNNGTLERKYKGFPTQDCQFEQM